MILARITGSVVSTIHHPIVDGKKMLLAERLYFAGSGAPRHDDLDAAAREYLDGKAPRTLAFSYGKARRVAGLFGVRKQSELSGRVFHGP